MEFLVQRNLPTSRNSKIQCKSRSLEHLRMTHREQGPCDPKLLCFSTQGERLHQILCRLVSRIVNHHTGGHIDKSSVGKCVQRWAIPWLGSESNHICFLVRPPHLTMGPMRNHA